MKIIRFFSLIILTTPLTNIQAITLKLYNQTQTHYKVTVRTQGNPSINQVVDLPGKTSAEAEQNTPAIKAEPLDIGVPDSGMIWFKDTNGTLIRSAAISTGTFLVGQGWLIQADNYKQSGHGQDCNSGGPIATSLYLTIVENSVQDPNDWNQSINVPALNCKFF